MDIWLILLGIGAKYVIRLVLELIASRRSINAMDVLRELRRELPLRGRWIVEQQIEKILSDMAQGGVLRVQQTGPGGRNRYSMWQEES